MRSASRRAATSGGKPPFRTCECLTGSTLLSHSQVGKGGLPPLFNFRSSGLTKIQIRCILSAHSNSTAPLIPHMNFDLLTVFLVIGGLGFAFLLISLVVGDIFEMFGGSADLGDPGVDFGFLDSRVLAVFITAFGGIGAIAAQMGFGAVASSFVGLLGGVGFAGMVSVFGRFLIGQQASSSVSDHDLIGRTVQVT